MKQESFFFNGYEATVLIPDNFNGKWIWKTEFFYAFDRAERDLFDLGFARVYYKISDMYGSVKAVRLMHAFQKELIKRYSFAQKAIMFGFSRGGLYAFNYALYYPEQVEKVYLDAPVLDIKTWPQENSYEQYEMFKELCLNINTLPFYKENPVDNLKEYFANKIPTMLIAGEKDSVVSYYRNSEKMIEYCKANGVELTVIIKPDCDHHPHSIENDTKAIIEFVTGKKVTK